MGEEAEHALDGSQRWGEEVAHLDMREPRDQGAARSPAKERAIAMERLGAETFDLLVIGGGVIGARIGYEAAQAGLSVALVDARDFGAGSSSASTKLIHGGLRYLQMRDFGLVREAHRERRALLDRLAPHLVRPLSFVVPVYRGGPYRTTTIAAGMITYAALSGFRHSQARMVGRERARRLVPDLRTAEMVAAGVYEDAQTIDSRLVLATITGAARAGAVVANHLAVTELEIAAGRVVAARAGDLRIRCRAVVNAAGPWVDEVRRMEDSGTQPMARLSKGVHLVLDLPRPWQAAVTVPLEEGRVSFAIPWEGMLLLGTTDSEYEGDPARVSVEPADVDQVLREAARAITPEVLARDHLRYSFAGLRVLPRSAGGSAAAPREEVVRIGPAGMVSVAGGKLTTHRQIAGRVLSHVVGRRWRSADLPLPGAQSAPPVGLEPDLAPDTWQHLIHLYGDEAPRVARSGGFERVHPGGPDIWAQVRYAIDYEWALTVEDIVRRRTTLAIRGLVTDSVREAVARALGTRGISTSGTLT